MLILTFLAFDNEKGCRLVMLAYGRQFLKFKTSIHWKQNLLLKIWNYYLASKHQMLRFLCYIPKIFYYGETYNFTIYDAFRQSKLLEHAVLTRPAHSLYTIKKQVLMWKCQNICIHLSTGYLVPNLRILHFNPM